MKKKIHIVSYTHWDREFRFDFETTRMWLTRLMDDLVEIMQEKPAFKNYMLDGQFTLVDDYLEVRPEQREAVKALAEAGRLQLGPWYTLPDSSSIHGESLVRNLMTGTRACKAFGCDHVNVGYNVFSFGQIGQLPQVYSGFGIDFILFYKHMDKTRVRGDEFWWESPDGSRAMATHLGREARWNFFFAGHIPIMYGLDPWHKDWQYRWGELGPSFHQCEPENHAGFHFITKPLDIWCPEKVREGFDRLLSTVEETTHAPEHLLAFDGTDFTAPHPMIPEMIDEANKVLADDGYEVVHSTLGDYAKAVRPLLEGRELDTQVGEMKDGPVGSIHTDVCSTHPELKRANSGAENVLFRQGEPLSALAWLEGRNYPKALIQKALHYLFSAQAHDSLHGVGPDDMCKDIGNRLLQAGVIGENLATVGMQELAMEINTSSMDGDYFVTVFNTATFDRTEVLELYLDLPRERMIESITLVDGEGRRAEAFLLEVADQRGGLYHPRSRNMPFYSKRYHLLFEAKDIPAMGHKVFTVEWGEKAIYPYPHEDFEPILIPASPLASDARTAENEFIAVELNADGTVNLTDKQTGKKHEGLNYYLDSGEAGTVYEHKPPKNNRLVTTQGMSAQLALVENTPLRCAFEAKTVMVIPSGHDKAEDARSEQTVEMAVTTRYTLRKGCPFLEVEVKVDNRARNHFLRACFPTGINAEKTWAGTVFDVNEYNTVIEPDGPWQGPALARHQQHLFMDIGDGANGFAVLNETLRDYEVLDAENGVVAHSLLRASKLRIPVDNRLWMEYPGDDSSQALGEHVIRYALMPHAGTWDEAGVMKQALARATPLRSAQIGRQEGVLPPARSMLAIEGSDNLVLSALKKAEDRDSIIARFYNPSNKAIECTLKTGFGFKEVHLLRIDETREESLASDGVAVKITADPHKIVTIEFKI
ncbi:MAG: glycoside hydrolase family 38 C-terminal domain-containing protein [Verrucomicrobiota bacterium]